MPPLPETISHDVLPAVANVKRHLPFTEQVPFEEMMGRRLLAMATISWRTVWAGLAASSAAKGTWLAGALGDRAPR